METLGVAMGIAVVNGTTGRHERPDASVGADIDRRIDELHAAARDDDLLPSRRSEDDARRFLGGLRLTARPSLFLLDNGNFRAV